MNPPQVHREGKSAVPPWLASLMMRRGSPILPRFAWYYRRLRGLSRPWRRRLRRQLAVGVTGAALLLAMSGAYAQSDPTAPEATITVVNGQVGVAANGQCSLIEAINNANSTTTGQPHTDCAAGNPGGADTLALPSGGDFVLTASNNTRYGSNGLPLITSRITINGNGSTIRRNAAAPSFRILFVEYSGNLTLNNVTISNGQASGSNSGGGIFQNSGDLTINNSTISNNTAPTSGGGIRVDYGNSLTITNSQILNNTASAGSGGGLYLHDVPTTISGSTISGNEAALNGGGVHIYNFNITLSTTTLSDNDAFEKGGGLYSDYANVSINRSTISGNFGLIGGGLFLKQGYTVGIVNSTISGNDSEYGGGVHIQADAGYSIRNIANSTISGNNAYYHGGGLDIVGPTRLNRNIIAGNTAGSGDEVFAHMAVTAANFNLFGRAGVNNAAAFVGFLPSGTDINATSNGTNTPLADIIKVLANYGGPTKTHSLPAGSPAIDRAPNAACNNAPISGVDQRGNPRNQNGAGGATTNECDIGSFERGPGEPPPASLAFYVSPATSGTVGGVAFAPTDILKFTPGSGWSMHFDGSDVGITKNVSAFEIQADNSILLSLGAGQNVGAIGSVAPHDVIRFSGTTGPNTSGTFQMWVDGSTFGLTLASEKIDALGLTADGRIAVSTVGALAVPKPGGGALKAQDEDATGFNRNTSAWSAFFNGTAIPGLGVEDVNALWVNPTTGELYISIVGAFNLGGVAGDGKDIVKLTPAGGGGYTPSLAWDGSAAGFPSAIDGLEIVP